MNSVVLSKTYAHPPFCEKEILRYAGCKMPDDKILLLLNECLEEAMDKLVYKVCYRESAVEIEGDFCRFCSFGFKSENLVQNLMGCERAVFFAATIGVGIDRLIAKYSRISPSKALMFQAIGAERIEALCDTFCADIAKEYNEGIGLRFSPGYGDLPLDCQRGIFTFLDCERRIGVTLNDSMLMSPSKSVTAVFGIGKKGRKFENKCSACNKSDCSFRGAL